LNGQSEKLLGKFLKEYPGSEKTRSGVCVATKLAAYPWRLTAGQFVKACRQAVPHMYRLHANFHTISIVLHYHTECHKHFKSGVMNEL
jgi:aryl-alcohol dehydrogenase-like predicted oxidoreductase